MSFLDGPWVVGSSLYNESAEFFEAVDAGARSLAVAVGPAYDDIRKEVGEAAATVFNQATNDFLDLCFDVLSGRGRSAMRSARALYEHNVNAHEMAASSEARDRYMSHQSVVDQIRSKLLDEAHLLRATDRKAFQYQLKKLGRATKRRADEAIAKFGSGFRRSWSNENLYELAVKHGQESGYDFYRVASSILHGSAAGSQGTIALTDDGNRIFRTGLAPSLCPTAFVHGSKHYEAMFKGLSLDGDARYEEFRTHLSTARQHWPAFRKAVLSLEGELWPEEMPPGNVAVFAVGSYGAGRWYVHDIENRVVRHALPPEEALPHRIQSRIDQAVEVSRRDADPDAETLTIAAIGVTVRPEPDSKWMPEGALLKQRPFGVHPTTPPWQWDLPPNERWDVTKGTPPPEVPTLGPEEPFE